MKIEIEHKDIIKQLENIAKGLETNPSVAAFILLEFGSLFLFITAFEDSSKALKEWKESTKILNPNLLIAFDFLQKPYKELIKNGLTIKDAEVLIKNRDKLFKA